MSPGVTVKALANHNRIKEDTKGVVVEGPKTGLRDENSWVWVRFEGHADPKLMRPSELETINFNLDYNF